MNMFDVQGVAIDATKKQVFDYIAEPENLPQWTNTFAQASSNSALLYTPEGEVSIDLEVKVSETLGTIDWNMTFPDGSLGTAFSRIVAINETQSVYTFTLMPPPVPLEALEGALDHQSKILAEELLNLKEIFTTDD